MTDLHTWCAEYLDREKPWKDYPQWAAALTVEALIPLLDALAGATYAAESERAAEALAAFWRQRR